MPSLGLVMDVEKQGFAALREYRGKRSADELEADGVLIHLGNGSQFEIGALTRGTTSGRASIMFCFRLPDGRVVLAETTLRLLLMAADTLGTLYGESAAPDGPPDLG